MNLKDLTSEELDAIIQEASNLREKMESEISRVQPYEQLGVVDPNFYVAPNSLGVSLQFRHPGLGWICFIIPPVSIKQLIKLINDCLVTYKARNN